MKLFIKVKRINRVRKKEDLINYDKAKGLVKNDKNGNSTNKETNTVFKKKKAL